MEQQLHKLNAIKQLTLSEEERGLVRAHAARIIMIHTPTQALVPSLFYRGIQHGLRIALSAMFFVVFVGGSVSAIANNALPGDPLYAFKINVNEEVKGAFLHTPEEKVVWQKNRIENRIDEIKTLAATKTLTKAKQEKAQAAINIHVQELSKELTVLSDQAPNTALNVTASLEQSLKGSKASLEASSEVVKSTDENTDTSSLMKVKVPSEDTTTVGSRDALGDALQTVNNALDQVSKEEVKILTKEINSISKEINTVDVKTNASSDTLVSTPVSTKLSLPKETTTTPALQ